MGQVVLHAPSMDSTQDFLFSGLRAPPDGLVCVADVQTQGKGRGNNEWISPPGCLLFSFTWSVSNAALLPFFQYLVSMALHRAVSSAVKADASHELGLRLKWPNDIYLVGADTGSDTAIDIGGHLATKIGGVLCQSTVAAGGGSSGSKPFRIVAGVGVNVLNAEPTCCLRGVLESRGKADAARAMSRERVLAAFCHHFEALDAVLQTGGFSDALLAEYLGQWLHSGQTVEVQIEDKSKDKQRAVIVGLTPAGFLRARCEVSGADLELHPDGNSLDMMRGLIYTKKR